MNMYRLVFLFVTLLFTSGCDNLNPCSGDSDTVVFWGSGPRIENPVVLNAGERYRYDLMNTVYIAEREGGRYGCPQTNRRAANIDSVAVENSAIATVNIEGVSVLELRAMQSGMSTVTVYLSMNVLGEQKSSPLRSVSTTIVVQ